MSIGLVLAGGGARGAYEIGAIKALDELGFKYDVITGTSVGALISSLLLSNKKEILYEVWENVDFDTVIEHEYKSKNKSFETMVKAPLNMGFDITPLENMLVSNIDEDAIRSNPIKGGLVYTEGEFTYKAISYNDIPEGEITNYVLTSCSAFPFLKKRTINGKKCKDGWFTDNVPIDFANKLGATKVIAIDVMLGVTRKYDKNSVEVLYLRPSKKLNFFLDFSNNLIKDMIKLGYEDTINKKDEILNFINS